MFSHKEHTSSTSRFMRRDSGEEDGRTQINSENTETVYYHEAKLPKDGLLIVFNLSVHY